jgi:hypothetical protein
MYVIYMKEYCNHVISQSWDFDGFICLAPPEYDKSCFWYVYIYVCMYMWMCALLLSEQLDRFTFVFSVQEFRSHRSVPDKCEHFSSKNRVLRMDFKAR